MNAQEILLRWNSLPVEQLVSRASQILPFWVSLLLVTLIAYNLAPLVWFLYPSSEDIVWAPPQPTVTATTTAGAAKATDDFQLIVNAHLFGTADAESVPIPEETVDAPDTRLNLSLRATIAADDDKMAHAIIADGSGDEKVYFAKDSIPGGASLHKIHADRVILNRGGTLETLRLPKEFEGSPTPPVQTARARPAAGRAAQNVIAENAAAFTQVIRPQPYMPNGQFKGYRLYPGRNRQQFQKLGLRPGDIVTEINGVKLNDPAQGMQVFGSLGDLTQVTAVIERGGQAQTLTLDTSQFSQMPGAASK